LKRFGGKMGEMTGGEKSAKKIKVSKNRDKDMTKIIFFWILLSFSHYSQHN
jgi:ribosomal protein L21E